MDHAFRREYIGDPGCIMTRARWLEMRLAEVLAGTTEQRMEHIRAEYAVALRMVRESNASYGWQE